MIQDGEAHKDDGCDGHWRRVNRFTVQCDKCGNTAYSRIGANLFESEET